MSFTYSFNVMNCHVVDTLAIWLEFDIRCFFYSLLKGLI